MVGWQSQPERKEANMNYQILELILAIVAAAGIIVGAVYIVKYNLLQNNVVQTVISVIETYLGGLLTTAQEQEIYTLLIDAIEAVVIAATPGESESAIEAAIITFINQGITDIPDFPPIDQTILAELVQIVISLVNALGAVKFVVLSKKYSLIE